MLHHKNACRCFSWTVQQKHQSGTFELFDQVKVSKRNPYIVSREEVGPWSWSSSVHVVSVYVCVCVCVAGVCSSVSVVDLRYGRARAGGNVLPEERRDGGRVLALQIRSVPLFPPLNVYNNNNKYKYNNSIFLWWDSIKKINLIN